MCGIFGYVGSEDASKVVHSGLKKLEYRGYDSCGIAFRHKGDIEYTRALGPAENIDKSELERSECAIGHTRWATHGEVNLNNAHPHHSWNRDVYLVHNGVIENYNKIKKFLEENIGCEFYGDTDSEILANLIAFYYWKNNSDPLEALRLALKDVEGTYGLAVIFNNNLKSLYGAKRGSPLIVGISGDNKFLVSDTNALPPEVDKVSYLEDNQIVDLNNLGFYSYNLYQDSSLENQIEDIEIDGSSADHKGYSCFMEKEILYQPKAVKNAMLGRINDGLSSIRFGGVNLERDLTKEIKRILFLGCGTAYHAGLVGKYAIENIADIPVTVEIGSEYKYKNNPTEEGTLAVAISQSGETSDTLSALIEAQNKGLDSMAITNVVSSSIGRQAGKGVYQHAGPEISVASTKAFTSQVTILLMLSILLGRKRALNVLDAQKYISELKKLPDLISETLLLDDEIKGIARIWKMKRKFIFLGRQSMYPIALEAALKLKELTYLDAQGYAAGEFKHGPLALINEEPLCFYFAPQDELLEKNISNIQEIRSRKGNVIVIAQQNQEIPSDICDRIIRIPNSSSFIQPILAIIPMQFFAMRLAQELKLDVDKPRNLAKSVTVE
jgi:glucosamine--fructose-6-phosphate aminotransferase (isomerizing)